MRVLMVHNRYQQAGGEDSVFYEEAKMFEEMGHHVYRLCENNDDITTFRKKMSAALATIYSPHGCNLVKQAIKTFSPDIMHVHNYFPRLSPYVFKTAHDAGIPTVHTLHNYRAICPSATFVVNGKIDETSIRSSSFKMIGKKVYKDSYLGTAVVASMIEFHKWKKTWKRDVDAYIALTEFAKNKFIQAGLPQEKIYVKPNFVDIDNVNIDANKRHGALFVGRITKEKGILTLLKAWESVNYPLFVVGGGEINGVSDLKYNNVEFIGELPRKDVYEYMKKSRFLIMPSEWYEGFPVTLCEAYATGLPVIASDIGSLSEIVEDEVTGFKFTPGNSEQLEELCKRYINDDDLIAKLSDNARRIYLDKYTKKTNYQKLLEIYEKAIDLHRVRSR